VLDRCKSEVPPEVIGEGSQVRCFLALPGGEPPAGN